MGNLNVIDRFTDTFIRYIDSGFGALNGEVAFLTSILVAIDITLVGLHWALDEGSNVMARLIKKVLYVGTFALILNNWQAFSTVIFTSFAGLGLRASGSGLTPDLLLRPGVVAGTGFEAAYPLLKQASSMLGFTTFFNNAVTIAVLLFAWAVVIVAFFVLAVQLFITIIEFKLTTLAGFVLVPFALWNKTVFLSERVLGNVIASGVKMMVLAVVIGIGTTLFGEFVTAVGAEPNLSQAMSLVLGSMALFGLGIFGPAIAAGLVSGAPQLGAGAVVGTAGAIAAGGLAGAGAALGLSRGGGSAALAAMRAGASLGSGASQAYSLARNASGASGVAGAAAGMAGIARAGAGAVMQGVRGFGERMAARNAESDSMPDWARRLQHDQRRRARTHTTMQAIREGDRQGGNANPDLRERD